MAKSHLNVVNSEQGKKKLDDALDSARNKLWRIESLARALYFDGIEGSGRLSSQDVSNIADLIEILAGETIAETNKADDQIVNLL